MSLVSSILRKHKKPSFFARHREAIGLLTDAELESIIGAQPDMMTVLLELDLPESFMKRVVFAGLKQTPRNIHRFTCYDHSEWLIEALCQHHAAVKTAKFLLEWVPKHKLTQPIFDFVVRQDEPISLHQLPKHLITRNNCLKILDMNPDQWRYVPENLIDEELALAMYRSDHFALKRIPHEHVTARVIAKGTTTLSHFEQLNAENRKVIVNLWLNEPGSVGLEYRVERPIDYSELIDRYREAERNKSFFGRKQQEAIFLEEVLQQAYLNDLWCSAKTHEQKDVLIKMHGKRLLEARDFPAELRRKWLEEDLSL